MTVGSGFREGPMKPESREPTVVREAWIKSSWRFPRPAGRCQVMCRSRLVYTKSTDSRGLFDKDKDSMSGRATSPLDDICRMILYKGVLLSD
jgi:hypothetical protein